MVKRTLVSVLYGVFAVITALLLAITVWLFGIQQTVFRPTMFDAIPRDDAFVSAMTGYILESVEAECLFYDLPYDTIKTVITEERVHTWSVQYTDRLYAAMTTGKPMEPFTVDATPFRAVLDTFFASLPADKQPLDAHAAETLSHALSDNTASVLSGRIHHTVTEYAHRYVYNNPTVNRVLALRGWLAALTVVLTALLLLPLFGEWRKRLYGVAGTWFMGSAFAWVPLWLLQQHGLADRLVLGASPLKLYADRVVNGIVNGMTTLAWWVWIVSAIVLVAAVFLRVRQPNTNKEQPRV